ncbi:MAG: polymer-forming cytoskeletal protein [Jannaschia helgolandensis]|jgi:cytoskeletal protein CcmA (bactofilin family)|uniref:Polymer-forming protein n=1 Tax=Jannaschia helgolandensis TaxID=188906 RepID=A0A1H7MQM3_9RHOB|nr:polymer-forming cytoskeletal protein [Jannaschia helgolandensis]SEL12907.1 Polymer-forming protein [Jannaschia helgolandensis]|tara:strand:- start:1251 stop:1796 length:546 start_codon:yes stop_codon:yes gene_type:complete
MFSKSKLNQPGGDASDKPTTPGATPPPSSTPPSKPAGLELGAGQAAMKPKVAPSSLSSDLVIKGDIKTSGDIQIEGEVEGNIQAHLLTVGEGAVVRGEVIADDIVVNGRVIGRVRGLKVRLTSTARVEGDIIHKTIAIESGAHFEGAVQRQDDPLSSGSRQNAKPVVTTSPTNTTNTTPKS